MGYELKPNDLLCFMHIPKTAGLSIIELLDKQFEKSQIFPWHTVKNTPTPRLFWYILLRMKRYRLVRGHYTVMCPRNLMRRSMPVDPVVVTMLREPVARTVSAYRHVIRRGHIPKQTTFLEYLTLPEYQCKVVNHQTRWLAGSKRHHLDRRNDWEWYSPDELLDKAKQNLETIAFFGIVEYFAESIQFMYEHFGWGPATELPHVNQAPEPFDLASLTDRERKAIDQCVELDVELYQYALKLFRQRYPSIEQDCGGYLQSI